MRRAAVARAEVAAVQCQSKLAVIGWRQVDEPTVAGGRAIESNHRAVGLSEDAVGKIGDLERQIGE